MGSEEILAALLHLWWNTLIDLEVLDITHLIEEVDHIGGRALGQVPKLVISLVHNGSTRMAQQRPVRLDWLARVLENRQGTNTS